MNGPLNGRVGRWVELSGIDPGQSPTASELSAWFGKGSDPCLPGIESRRIDDWEDRHGYSLPRSLRAWLTLSNGFYLDGPFIHPLSAIGPMIPFASVPELWVQPESWFELGNPNVETICIDLGYQWPTGGNPIFTSGDDLSGSRPRLIAPSFESWFLELLRQGGREYWFDPGFEDLGHPWQAHLDHTPTPSLPDRLRPMAQQVRPLLQPGADERLIASSLGITLGDVELIFRHLQHGVGRSSET